MKIDARGRRGLRAVRHGAAALGLLVGLAACGSGGGAPSSPPVARGGLAVGQSLAGQKPVETLTGQPTSLALGRRATVVVLMATWCRYCGYEDRWVVPGLVGQPGVAVDLVDVSPYGGIASPGPQSPPFSGQDHIGKKTTVAGMRAWMARYAAQYGLPPGVHLYVAPSETQASWKVASYPTIVLLDGSGTVRRVIAGAFTSSKAALGAVQQVESGT
ncbi:MAG: hypothetical protein K6V97_09970 [Actinomycetia bacterium]|nr:hypothetical protein [Actinomycetes bacterium]